MTDREFVLQSYYHIIPHFNKYYGLICDNARMVQILEAKSEEDAWKIARKIIEHKMLAIFEQ